MKKIDARGLSCPEPVILFRKALCPEENEYEITVDNITSKENVIRAAEHEGFSVSVTTQNDEIILTIIK